MAHLGAPLHEHIHTVSPHLIRRARRESHHLALGHLRHRLRTTGDAQRQQHEDMRDAQAQQHKDMRDAQARLNKD